MSRGLSAGMQTEVQASTLRPFFLISVNFPSAPLLLWDGYGDLIWSAATWLGNGWFQGFTDIREDNDINSKGVDILLSGVPQSLVSLILTEARHSVRGTIRIGMFDSSGAIIADPYLLFEGALSAPRIDESGETSQLTLTFEDDLIRLNRDKELRYTHESQQSIFSADLGFQYVAKLQDWNGFWGTKKKPKKKTDSKTSRKKTSGDSRR